ncbi:rod shape-determining protein [[Clostridium] polysaccharolyticum]|uniref:Cell shape-determining protein MreB n=1 Tax=[Clostridium] polysaccharolyticum TaxID=29364 RepID=A0A1I0E3A7_9FIRM|nr:rod shape-determining protein [[Clostridium] polysaccharolyticum]SET39357.1 rod shape-determining protein MreB [[Clostridium] polysaccharolyticum]
MAKKVFGIDFGTSVIKIFKKGEGIVVDEKNVVATKKKKLYAGGNDAYDMFEKAPENITVSYPMRAGVIAEIENMRMLLDYFVQTKCFKKGVKSAAEFVVAVPTNITEVEKRAFDELVRNAVPKIKDVVLIEKPIVAALGIGLDVVSPRGVMTVDIGADTTEIGIISLGGIVLSKLIPVGGNKIDETIQLLVKKNHNLYIGRKTAEMIKMELGSAVEAEETAMKVFGRDVVTGLPKQQEIDSSLVCSAVREHLYTIVDAIKMILEHTPPEITSDIIDSGIFLTGGSAKIKELDKLISEETDLMVNVSEDCENSVARGLGVVMDDDGLLGQLHH